MTIERLRLGNSGEEIATNFLETAGYRIVTRNYRCRLGEIDIIARDGRTLVFIEVKTRKNMNFGPPAAAVTLKKQRQISRTAQWYLTEHGLFDIPARFDVVSIMAEPNGRHQIEHLPGAFEFYE